MGPQAIIRTKLELLALLCVEFVDGKKRPIAMQTVEQSDIEEAAREFLDAVELTREPMTDPERRTAIAMGRNAPPMLPMGDQP